jgi:protein Tex
MPDAITFIATQLQLPSQQIQRTIALLDDGNTIPFIARYRKEQTGALDEDQLRQTQELLQKHRALEDRRASILTTIEEQDKLTDELRGRIDAANTLTELEDLYLPFKPRRRTRATIAREQGLEPLAEWILHTPRHGKSPDVTATDYINHEVPDAEQALAGARDIVAEDISNHPDIRATVREKAQKYGQLHSGKARNADDPKGTYTHYYDFDLRVQHLRPHQVLAMNRGESEGVLSVKLNLEERDWYRPIEQTFRPHEESAFFAHFQQAATDGARRLLIPAIERDIRRLLSEHAERHAIEVFANNLRALLTQPPLTGHIIMGVDPAFRTGCKVAVIDQSGAVLETTTVYPTAPQRDEKNARQTLDRLIHQHNVTLIAIGNGTASRETEQFIATLTRDRDDVHYLIVNEAGASVYSASELARQELPDLDVTLRGAVSIARRVLDPLAELVKIDPKSIGVGLYQHDVNQNELAAMLGHVVETVVNQVGVDVNTASPTLLQHVAGVGPKLADNIIAHRQEISGFKNRRQLLDVPKLGPKSFEQAAGFLRVRGGDNPLDSSAIHPESYAVAEAVLAKAQTTFTDDVETRTERLKALQPRLKELATKLNVGVPTLQDIFEQLLRPGRDPREDVQPPLLRRDVLSMNDLKVGMRLQGTVRNVVDFGAFIDIGVKQDGLLHRSQQPRGLQLSVGDVLEVEIQNVDMERGRIGFGVPADQA